MPGNPVTQFMGRRRIIQSGAFQIAELLNGWARNNNGAVPVQGGKGQYTLSQTVNMNRLNYLGHMAPGEVFTALQDGGNVVNGLPLNAATISLPNVSPFNGRSYVSILSTGRVVMFDMTLTPPAIAGYWDVPLQGIHASHTAVQNVNNNDCLVFEYTDPSLGPTPVLLYTWEDANDADIAIVGQNYGASGGYVGTPNFFSSMNSGAGLTLTKGVPHKMAIHPNGMICILNGEYIATMQQTTLNTTLSNFTANNQRLHLGAGWTATSIRSNGIYAEITAYQPVSPDGTQARCRLFLWDGANADPNFAYDLPDNYVSNVFDMEGIPFTFSKGIDGSTKIMEFTGGRFKEIFKFPPFYTGVGGGPQNIHAALNPPPHAAIDHYMDTVCFVGGGTPVGINFGGVTPAIYQFDGKAIHQVMPAGDQTFFPGQTGFLKNLDASGLYLGMGSTGSSPTYKIFYLNPLAYATSAFLKTCLYALPPKATISSIKIFFSNWGAGSAFKLSMYSGYDQSHDLLNLSLSWDGSVSGSRNVGTSITKFIQPLHIANLDSVWFNLQWTHAAGATAAIIRAIEVEYVYTSQPA